MTVSFPLSMPTPAFTTSSSTSPHPLLEYFQTQTRHARFDPSRVPLGLGLASGLLTEYGRFEYIFKTRLCLGRPPKGLVVGEELGILGEIRASAIMQIDLPDINVNHNLRFVNFRSFGINF